jgi:predicted enzyme related to lactoylglutathione lyase
MKETPIGKLGLIMLVTHDMEKSTAFYRDVLGLKLMFSAPAWTQFDAGNIHLGLHSPSERLHAERTNSVQFGFYVDDIQKAAKELKSKGVHFVMEPAKQEFGWLAVFSDPDGYHIQLGQLER